MAIILTPQITEAGKEAAINASNTGVEISITAMSYGRAFYTPDGSETALVDQIISLEIASGSRVAPNQIRLASVWSDNAVIEEVGEIGFWADSVLFAVWSRDNNVPIAIKTPEVDLVAFYDLAITAVPPNSVNIIVSPDASEALAALGAHEADQDAHPQYLLRSQFVNAHALMWCGTSGGTASALTLTAPTEQVIAAYTTGMRLTFKASLDNTGAVTVNVATLGVKSIKKSGAADLQVGDIKAGSVYDLVYDGVNFQLAGGLGGSAVYIDPLAIVATSGQFVFNVAYTPGLLRVCVNGRVLSPSDYTAGDGSTVTLTSGLNEGDQFLAERLMQFNLQSQSHQLMLDRNVPDTHPASSISTLTKPSFDNATNVEDSLDHINDVLGSAIASVKNVSLIDGGGVLSISPSDGKHITLTGHGAANFTITGFGSNCPVGYEFDLYIPRTIPNTGGTANALGNYVQFDHTLSGDGLDLTMNSRQYGSSTFYSYQAYSNANNAAGNKCSPFEQLGFVHVGSGRWLLIKMPSDFISDGCTVSASGRMIFDVRNSVENDTAEITTLTVNFTRNFIELPTITAFTRAALNDNPSPYAFMRGDDTTTSGAVIKFFNSGLFTVLNLVAVGRWKPNV